MIFYTALGLGEPIARARRWNGHDLRLELFTLAPPFGGRQFERAEVLRASRDHVTMFDVMSFDEVAQALSLLPSISAS
jgi:hypothetical protein